MKEGKADNEHSNPCFYCPSPLNSQHLHFSFTVASLSKIFVRSRRDWEKKCRVGTRHSPSSVATASQNSCILFVPFLQRMPTHGNRGVGGNFAGREGGNESMKWWWWGMMMKWLTFYILYTTAFWELEGNTKLLFVLTFAFWTLLCSLHTLLWK